MVRRHGTLQLDREEQLQLRGQLANVYDNVRDLGVHFKMIEIPGCSFITIGRSEHKYSHLDKNLTLTAPTAGACDNIQYGEQNSSNTGYDRVSPNEKDQAIHSLQMVCLEKEEEMKFLKLQLTDLSSQLQAAYSLANNDAETKQSLSRTALEQKEELKRLTLQISKLSSTPQSNAQKEELTLRAALKQEEEKNKLNQKLAHLSNQLESCTVAKNKAEKLAGEHEDSAKHYRIKLMGSENVRRNDENSYKIRINDCSNEQQNLLDTLGRLVQERDSAREKNSKLTTSLESSENKLLTVCQEVEDKDNEIKVISDQNKGLEGKIAKLVKKADQLQEDLELQLAFQHNLDLKTTTPEALTANEPKVETKNHLPQALKSGQEEGSREITDALNKHKDESAEPNNCQATEDATSSQAFLTEFQVTLLNRRKAVDKKNDTIATAVAEQFMSAFMDDKFLRSSRGHHRYTKTVMRGIMSKEGLESIAAVIGEVTRSVDNVDNVPYWAEPEMVLAESLGNKIQQNLPKLMEILHDLELFDYPWLGVSSYTRSEICRILQQKQNQFLAKTKEICKEFVTEMDMADLLGRGTFHPSDLDLAALKSAEDVVNQPSKTPNNGQKYGSKDTTTVLPKDLEEIKSDESNASEENEDDWRITEYSYQVEIIQNWVDTLVKKSDIIASEIVDLFLSAFTDEEFLDTRDRPEYSLAVMRVIMSEHGLDTMAVTLDGIARTVENVDDLWIKPDYTTMAADLGKVIQHSLPILMEILRDDSVPHDIIAIGEHSPVFDIQLWAKIKVLVEDLLENDLKLMALESLNTCLVSDDSEDDSDTSTSESDEEQASPAAKTGRSSIAELISPRYSSSLLTTMTSTPNKNQGDEDTGKEENFNENTTDSGMGTSGIFTSDQTNTSECKILESNSSLSNPDDEEFSQEPTAPGNEDTGKDENFNEKATVSGMGTSGILTTSAQTKNSECKILETNSSLSNLNDEASSQEQTEWGFLIHGYDAEEWV
jgi:hypothetical protein